MAESTASSTFQAGTTEARIVEEATTFLGVFSSTVSFTSAEKIEAFATATHQDPIVISLTGVSPPAPAQKPASLLSASSPLSPRKLRPLLYK